MEPTILIAEDDLVSRVALTRRLEGWGYPVVAVADGQAAWDLLQGPNAPPIAILDWTMPAMDGLEVCRRLRLNQQDRYTYVVLLSGRESKEDLITALRAGVDDYLVKPCDWTQLEARLVVALRILSLQAQLLATRERLRQEATHDPLTGLWNRRAAVDALRRDLARAGRENEALSLMLVDLDNFKGVNDCWGHPAGDRVLVETASRIRRCVRGADSIARWGGEELLVVLPAADALTATEVAERLRRSIAEEPFDIGSEAISVTASVGVVVSYPDLRDQWEDLVRLADEALYRAKREGRNRVDVQGSPMTHAAFIPSTMQPLGTLQ
ncbi:MAG TPA: diguanylate cyclase [Thermoanaerobaculia bacterium]|jgi:diguanylate cyclase (GGDEF)-like protein|nr:diguanylate cyclase [Thermoanaerobaculia bacterium]